MRESEQRLHPRIGGAPCVLRKLLGGLLIVFSRKIRGPQPCHCRKVIRVRFERRFKRRLGFGELPLFELDDTTQLVHDRVILGYLGRRVNVFAGFGQLIVIDSGGSPA